MNFCDREWTQSLKDALKRPEGERKLNLSFTFCVASLAFDRMDAILQLA